MRKARVGIFHKLPGVAQGREINAWLIKQQHNGYQFKELLVGPGNTITIVVQEN